MKIIINIHIRILQFRCVHNDSEMNVNTHGETVNNNNPKLQSSVYPKNYSPFQMM